VTRAVRILDDDRALLEGLLGEPFDDASAARAIERGCTVLKPTPGDAIGELAAAAADLAELRFALAFGRDRAERSERETDRTYARRLSLDREVVPPLKQEAMRLRAEVRSLERELRECGGDPDAVRPAIAWERTLAVEGYLPPVYVDRATRRRAMAAFFGRIREPWR
jgi:hypothetical protein